MRGTFPSRLGPPDRKQPLGKEILKEASRGVILPGLRRDIKKTNITRGKARH